MHHRKTKAPPVPAAAAKGSKDPGFEAMQRLRYLNKKPLCLQYNVLSRYAKRNNNYRAKRQEQSFVLVLALGLIRLVHWLTTVVQNEVWEFITTPAEQLFPSEPSCFGVEVRRSSSCTRRKQSFSRRSVKCSYRRDFGRTARLQALQERRAQLCYL